jgi:hypothetical protein
VPSQAALQYLPSVAGQLQTGFLHWFSFSSAMVPPENQSSLVTNRITHAGVNVAEAFDRNKLLRQFS